MKYLNIQALENKKGSLNIMVYITRYALSDGKILKGKIIEVCNLENDRTHEKRKTYVVQSDERKFLLNDEDFSYSFDEAINKAET